MIERDKAHALLDQLLDAREEYARTATENDKDLRSNVVEPAVALFGYVAGDAMARVLHNEGLAASAGGKALPKVEDFKDENGNLPGGLTEERLFLQLVHARALSQFVSMFRQVFERAHMTGDGLARDLLGITLLPGRVPIDLPQPVRPERGPGASARANLAEPAAKTLARIIFFEAGRNGWTAGKALFQLWPPDDGSERAHKRQNQKWERMLSAYVSIDEREQAREAGKSVYGPCLSEDRLRQIVLELAKYPIGKSKKSKSPT